MSDRDTSKFISLILRDKPETIGINLDEHGWANFDDLIIGVNNIDTHMRRQEILERMEEEQTVYSKLAALSGKYICVYSVDPETDSYYEYGTTGDYEKYGLSRQGENFFTLMEADIDKNVYSEDRTLFRKTFSKKKILQAIIYSILEIYSEMS
jgi:hypothetical protein